MHVTDEMVEQIAIQVHYLHDGGHSLKWGKQPGKYRASIRRDVRDVIAALEGCGLSIGKRSSALAAEQAQPVAGDLDTRMKAAGMYTIAEMMCATPLTRWMTNPAINTIEAFSEWLDRKVSGYLQMKAGYDLGDKSEDDELFEWVEAHAAVFSTIRDQFRVVRSALVTAPANGGER